MSEDLLKLLAAYAAGTAATAFMVSLVWLLPIDGFAKQLLSWILPLPVILIVLVLLYHGPQSFAEREALPATPRGIAGVLLTGAFSLILCYAVVPVTKYVLRRFLNDQDEESESGE